MPTNKKINDFPKETTMPTPSKLSPASTSNGLGCFIKIFKIIFLAQSNMSVFVPCPDSHALSIQAAVIKPCKSTSSPHRNSLDIIPVPVVDWVPPLEHDLPLLDVQLPPPAATIIIDHSTQVIRYSSIFTTFGWPQETCTACSNKDTKNGQLKHHRRDSHLDMSSTSEFVRLSVWTAPM